MRWSAEVTPTSMQPPIFRFGRFSLDTGAGLLRSGAEEVALRNKSLELLTYLVRNAGRVVLTEELLTAVWNGLNVTENSLTQCIHDIRRALDDSERALIRTVPRRGYIFPADALETISLLPDPAQFELSAAKIKDRPALAVLPFVNIGGAPENQFFAAGMSEDITTALSRIGELFIIAPHADYAGRGNSATLKGVAEELGARYVLKGSVRVNSNKLRVTRACGKDRPRASPRGKRWYRRAVCSCFLRRDRTAKRSGCSKML
jgi:DNA-binding winged helix-turn-helix (wHTH) protein